MAHSNHFFFLDSLIFIINIIKIALFGMKMSNFTIEAFCSCFIQFNNEKNPENCYHRSRTLNDDDYDCNTEMKRWKYILFNHNSFERFEIHVYDKSVRTHRLNMKIIRSQLMIMGFVVVNSMLKKEMLDAMIACSVWYSVFSCII